MNKARALKILNPLLAVLVIAQICSGLLFAPYRLHLLGGLVIAAVVGTHLFLNWGWVRANYLKR